MGIINRIFWSLWIIAILCLFLALNVFIGLYVISLIVVPLTWAYAAATGRSYHFVIDQSQFLYIVNRIGQWSWFLTACLAVTYILIWANL
jgi:hypothetical protein